MSVKYALTGADITVTADGATHRAYAITVNRGGSQVGARAFEDDPDEEAIVLTTKYTDITVSFRDDISADFDLGDEVALITTFNEVSITYNVKITSTVKSGTADGIADFSFNCRVLPSTT